MFEEVKQCRHVSDGLHVQRWLFRRLWESTLKEKANPCQMTSLWVFFHPFGWVTHAPFGFYWNTTWEYWGIMWYSNMGMFCLRPRSSQEIGRQWVAEESAGSFTKLLVQEKFPYLNIIYKVENINRLRSNITDGSIWKNKVIWMCLFLWPETPKVLEANWRRWTGNVELTL